MRPWAQIRMVGLLMLLWTAAGALPGQAQEAPAPYAEAAADADHRLAALRDQQGVAGLTGAVWADGRIVWSDGVGHADVEHRVPAWPHTRMRVGSVSKSMTAAAVGRLVEEGRLDLDASIQQYVPSFPEKRYPITTRQLGGHLAGIRHYRGDEFLSTTRYETVLDGLVLFRADTLLHEPGTAYRYSSYGWNLISAVVEGASGRPFLEYMRDAVFQPLGLRHTVADHTDRLIDHRTGFYERDDAGRLVPAPYVDNSYKWAGGGFLSTAEDLVRFGGRLVDGAYLQPETLELLFTSQRTADGEATGYGIGWSMRTLGELIAQDSTRAALLPRPLPEDLRLVWHTGGSVGGITALVLLPERGVAAALISNTSGIRDLGDALLESAIRLALRFDATPPAPRPPAEADPR